MSEDVNQEILVELRRVSSIGRRLFWLIVLLFLGSVLASVSRRPPFASSDPSWNSVDASMSRQDFPKALEESKVLVARQPNYDYGHSYLGAVYTAIGDLTNAETHYLRAYELFPDEANRKSLAAIRQRLAEQQPVRLLSK